VATILRSGIVAVGPTRVAPRVLCRGNDCASHPRPPGQKVHTPWGHAWGAVMTVTTATPLAVRAGLTVEVHQFFTARGRQPTRTSDRSESPRGRGTRDAALQLLELILRSGHALS